MEGVKRHLLRLWPSGWGALLPLPIIAYAVAMIFRGEFRSDHFAFLVLVPVLAYTHPRTKKLFLGLYPFCLVGLLYDSSRYYRNLGVSQERVHLCDLRALDAKLFGVGSGDARVSLPEWFQAHRTDALDLWCSIPYGTFIFASIALAAYLYFKDFSRMQRFMWIFFVMNVMGFITYHVYPAAPPWYYGEHGCVVDLLAKPNEGPNLAHVDQLLGIPYFKALYGRGSEVYGAVPSLHVAYPLLMLLIGWPVFGRTLRVVGAVYFATMLLAAPYLYHHWVVDEILGLVYGLGTFAVFQYFATRGRMALAGEPMLAR